VLNIVRKKIKNPPKKEKKKELSLSYRNHVVNFVLTNPFTIPGFDIVGKENKGKVKQ
jgi:hypothetical protein